jgi:hypothetical protein
MFVYTGAKVCLLLRRSVIQNRAIANITMTSQKIGMCFFGFKDEGKIHGIKELNDRRVLTI